MANCLVGETSPYLLQHADNPVEWYPWGEQALERARREDRPILLSIGYSACHWCHVMAHESFEDPEVAAVMNREFVNIKVDREERPDLDQIYQLAHQMLTQRAGGWPLTMFLTPDGTPFFGGTYFPKEPRYGLPGFPDLVQRVAQVYRTRRQDIEEQNQGMVAALARTVESGAAGAGDLDEAPLAAARRLLEEAFDPRFGGFGGAPKFPHPADLQFLLRRQMASADAGAREMVFTTLTRMAEGGIYDQLGGGFCRYSVDERWNIPHFEKMLYDNGPLLRLCADAWALGGEPLYARVAEETADWVMREMQAPAGGYYSALDADSEHEEGKFYVWDREAVQGALADEEYAVLSRHYGLDQPPNFENRHWHFHVARALDEVAQELAWPAARCAELLVRARGKLFALREQRVRPGRDDKILTSWNALMIEGMARAATVFGRPDWLDSAFRAADYLRGNLWRDGRLLATGKDRRGRLNAYLDDHAFLINALLELTQARFRPEDLEWAEDLADLLLSQFEDRDVGGFFFTSHDHERLIHRTKPGHDNATPSGNGVAAFALQRLGHLTGETRYLDAARRALQLFQPQMTRHPAAFASLMAALEEYVHPPQVVILRGPPSDTAAWQRQFGAAFLPATLVLDLAMQHAGLPPVLDKPAEDAVNAWVCSGVNCLPPVRERAELERICKTRYFS